MTRARTPKVGQPSVADLSRAVTELHKRVRREIERYEAPRGAGTELAGGWAKLGNRLQDVLGATIEWLAEADGVEPLDQLRAVSSQERSLAEASFLTLGKVIRTFAKSPASQAVPVQRLLQDALARESLIKALAQKRRDKVHERETEAQLTADLKLLRDFELFIRRVKADLAG